MPKAKWTVMVLMGANNVEGEGSLSEFAESDLAEMQRVGSKDDVLNIVVQIDTQEGEGPRRFKMTQQGETDVVILANGKGSSGDPSVLRDFLRWAKSKPYQAEHYLLVLWGHAYQLAFNRDPDNTDGLDFVKLAEEIDRTNENGNKLDIVAFDSCNVSLIEGAYQLRNSADFLVASQFSDPLPGWPYEEILNRIIHDSDNFTGHDGTRDLARAIVSQFVRNYVRKDHVTMTALDLSHMDEFAGAIGDLSGELMNVVRDDDYELSALEESFQRSQVPGRHEEGQPSVDLITFCWHLINLSRSPRVKVTAAALSDLLFFPADGNGSRNPFIVAHGRNDIVVSMLQGVSIFAPNVMGDGDFASLRSRYGQLELARRTQWDDLVFGLAD